MADESELRLSDGTYFAAIPGAKGAIVSRDRAVVLAAERELRDFGPASTLLRDLARHILDRPQGGAMPQTFESWAADLVTLAKDARELLGEEGQ